MIAIIAKIFGMLELLLHRLLVVAHIDAGNGHRSDWFRVEYPSPTFFLGFLLSLFLFLFLLFATSVHVPLGYLVCTILIVCQ
jgi:hypothetical protein